MSKRLAWLTACLALALLAPTLESQQGFWVRQAGTQLYRTTTGAGTSAITIRQDGAGNGIAVQDSAGTNRFSVTGGGTITALAVVTTANIQAANTGFLGFTGGSQFQGATDKLIQLESNAGTSGLEINVSPATLGTCTGGTITTGAHSGAGGYTGNTSSSCVVNFGTNWTNAPFCVAMSIASTTHPRVSATAASSITITGGVSGEAITYLCTGRIGT